MQTSVPGGSIRSGTDVVKALAMEASAVLVGRPVFHALAVGGMAGVAHILHMLRVELELTMTQLGCDAGPYRCELPQSGAPGA